MATNTSFLKEQRELLGDLDATGWQDADLNIWRDEEIASLYSNGLFYRATTRGGTETTVVSVLAGDGITQYVPRYYTTPTGFRRIYGIDYVDPITDEVVAISMDWDDLEEPGKVRVDDAPWHVGYNLRFFGEKEFATVSDAQMKQEILNVVLYGSVLRALVAEFMKRTNSTQSIVSQTNRDTSSGALANGLNVIRALYRDARTKALAVQPRTTIGR